MLGSSRSSEYVKEATRIADLAEKIGIPLRIMGCCAVRIHSPRSAECHEGLMKRHVTDIDFVTLSKHSRKARELFVGLGYAQVRLSIPQGDRIIFVHSEGMRIDVFLDRLSMSHVIDFRNRLDVDSPTISLADILLEKIQIVKINEKDAKDVIVLLRDHEVGDSDKETINAGYISKLLASDWGFHHTGTTNLTLIRDDFMDSYCYGIFEKEDIADMKTKVSKILERIDREPKSRAWKIRAQTGTKRKWYQDVEEVQVGQEFQNELSMLLRER